MRIQKEFFFMENACMSAEGIIFQNEYMIYYFRRLCISETSYIQELHSILEGIIHFRLYTT